MGSVVDFTGDALVNAANEACLSGGGVDAAVTSAGGTELAAARLALPQIDEGVRCRTGDAVVTRAGGKLNVEHVIHAVGPNYSLYGDDVPAADAALRAAYLAAMRRASEQGVRTVAFPLLSAGLFRGTRSIEHVVQIAVATLTEHLLEPSDSRASASRQTEVTLVANKPEERNAVAAALLQFHNSASVSQSQASASSAPSALPTVTPLSLIHI